MTNRKLKIVLDTNILISFLITNQLNKLDKQIISGKIMLLFSNELIEEFITVTQRPKLLKLFSKSDVESLLGFFFKYGRINQRYEPQGKPWTLFPPQGTGNLTGIPISLRSSGSIRLANFSSLRLKNLSLID